MKIKALHVASFDGNVGDIGQIMGFRQQLSNNTNLEIEYSNLEIREFYKSWGMRQFGEQFVKYANCFDLLIFGGGNFWSVEWQYSPNGTTLALSKEILDQIHIPVWFNAIGFDDRLNFAKNKIKDFAEFIKYIAYDSHKYFISVRNDGSYKMMSKYFSGEVMRKISEVPDGGFFVKPHCYEKHIECQSKLKTIVINPAGDMISIRFTSEAAEVSYIVTFAEQIRILLEKYDDIEIVFVAHHHDDFRHINALIAKLPDWFRRRRISVAPFIPNWHRAEYIFDLYRQAHMVIGGRFHSNLCAIAQGTPTIGILSYHKHKYIYDHYLSKDRMLEVDKGEIANLSYVLDKYMQCENYKKACKDNISLQKTLGVILTENHRLMEKWITDFYKK